ncbi:hypothetical protein [Mesorhizobium sp. M0590]
MTGSIYSDFLADGANIVTIISAIAGAGLILWRWWRPRPPEPGE